MKTVARFLTFLLILTLVPTVFVPAVSAYSWTEIAEFEIGLTSVAFGSPGYQGGGVAMSDTNILFGMQSGNSGPTLSFQVMHCSTTSCESSGSVLRTSASLLTYNFHRHNTTSTAYACTTLQDVHFHKSIDGGYGWTDTTATTDSGSLVQGCDVATYDGTHYGIVWVNQTTDDWVFSVSNTGGGSGSWTTYLMKADTSLNGFYAPALFAYSATEYVALVQDSSQNIDKCRTTNSGVTWSCVENVVTGVDYLNAEMSQGIAYFAIADQGTASVRIGYLPTSTDDPITKSVTATGLDDTGDADLSIYSSSRWAVSFVERNTGQTAVGYVAETMDSGNTWSLDVAYTTPSTTIAGESYTGVAYTSSGNIVSSFGYQVQDDQAPGTVDGDSVNERIFAAVSSGSAGVTSSTISVTDLTGFDMDYEGQTIIARTNLGDNVRTWSAQTLSVKGATSDLDCTDGVTPRYDGVFSIGTHIAYLDCTINDPDFLRVRSDSVGTPSFSDAPNVCDETLNGDISLEGGNGENWDHGDVAKEWNRVDAYPIDFSQSTVIGGGGVTCAGRLALALSTTAANGEIGVATFTNFGSGLPDRRYEAKYAMGGGVDQVCSFTHDVDGDGDAEQYIAGAGANSNTRVFRVDFAWSGSGLVPSLVGPLFDGSGGHGSAIGLACSGDTLVLQSINDGKTHVLNWTSGQDVWSQTVTGSTRGVAITNSYTSTSGLCRASANATVNTRHVLHYDAGVVKVATRASPTVITTLTPPSGDWRGLRVQECAQLAVVATDDNIRKYQIANVTTGGPASIADPNQEPPVDPGTGLFAGSGATVGAAFGTGAFGGNLFLGAVLMGIVAYGVGTGYGNTFDERQGSRALRVNPWAAAVGAAMGFMLAWGFGFFSTAVVFSMVVLIGMVVGIRLWVSRGG